MTPRATITTAVGLPGDDYDSPAILQVSDYVDSAGGAKYWGMFHGRQVYCDDAGGAEDPRCEIYFRGKENTFGISGKSRFALRHHDEARKFDPAAAVTDFEFGEFFPQIPISSGKFLHFYF